jgi:hypothetical protein
LPDCLDFGHRWQTLDHKRQWSRVHTHRVEVARGVFVLPV